MNEQSQRSEEKNISSGLPAATKSSEGGRFYLWAAALAAVLAILLHASLFEGKGLVSADGIFNLPPWAEGTNRPSNLVFSDQYLVFIPQHEFTYRQFLQGRFPLWNPNLDCGMPNLASMDGALLFPINLLLLPIAPFYAAGIAAFLKLFLAGLFTMLYMRLLGASNGGAFLSGLVFSLSGFMVCWIGHPHVNCAMCLPLLLYLIEKSFRYGSNRQDGVISAPALRVWAWLGIIFACLLSGGHPPTMVQVTIFVGFYFLFRLIWERGSDVFVRTLLIISAGVLGLFLAAPQLFPFFEYYRHSSLDETSISMDRTSIHFGINTLIFYLFPHLCGGTTGEFEEMRILLNMGALPNFIERTGYVGVLPLLFAIYAMLFRRGRWTAFYGFTILLCLLAAWGMPPFPALFGTLPVLRDINPTRLIMIAGFSVAVLAGLGWDSFLRLENHRKQIWLVAGFWVVIGLILFWCWHFVGPARWKLLDAFHRSFLKSQFLMLIGSLVTSVALLLPSIRKQRSLFSIIGLGWVAMDLLNFGMGLNPAISRDLYYPGTPAIEWLQQDKTDFRILSKEMILPPNTAELYGLKDARGCDYTTVRRYEELIEGKAGQFFFYRMADSLPNALSLLSVKYVFTFTTPRPDPALFELVYSNEISIYRQRQFYGRAMTVFDYIVEKDPETVLAKVRSGTFDPHKTVLLEEEPNNAIPEKEKMAVPTNSEAHIISEQSDEVTVEASISRPGFLLLLDTYFPGWKATVNGLESPILRADYNFRAVRLPAGKSVVRFVYQPQSFRLGIAFFLAGLFILGATIFGSFWKAKRRARSGLNFAQ